MIRIHTVTRGEHGAATAETIAEMFTVMGRHDLAIVDFDSHKDFIDACHALPDRLKRAIETARLASIGEVSGFAWQQSAVYALPGEAWRVTYSFSEFKFQQPPVQLPKLNHRQ